MAADEELSVVRTAFFDREYSRAIKQLDTLIAGGGEERQDYLLYLKCLGQFYEKDFSSAIANCERFLSKYKESDWHWKAIFLKAQCHLRLKQFREAEEIYETEAKRLLSSARKEEVASAYVRFAEALSRKPAKDELDAPPPNYEKAYNLYNKATELEIGRDLQDDVKFQLGRMRQLDGKHGKAIREYRGYLSRFDPDWLGPVDSPRRQKKLYAENPIQPGRHIYSARHNLAASQLARGQHQRARINLEDLLSLLPETEDGLIRDSQFLITRTYGIPNPQTDADLELGVKSAKSFLSSFPGDIRSAPLAYEIAEAYQNRGRSEEASSAYQHFIEGRGFNLPEGEAAAKKDETGESPSEGLRRLRMSATYKIGQIRFAQKNYAGAIETWNRYVKEFPNGPQWTDGQQGIVNAEFQKGVDLLAGEKYNEAIRAWDEFLTNHPLDSQCRQVMFAYGQIHYHLAEGDETVEEAELRKAVAEWGKLVNKYPQAEESSLALFRIGQIYEEKLGNLERALESYRKLNWGSWQDQAQRRIAEMTDKKLELVTERVFRTNEPARVKVTLRNIEKATVSIYKLNLESYWRKMHRITGIKGLDISLIAPNKTWEYEVAGYQQYKLFDREIEIPMGDAGVYAVNVGEEDLEATTLVIRSDIDAIVKTSKKEVLVFAENMLKGEAAPEAKVLVSDGARVICEGETKDDGVFQGELDQLKEANQVSIFVIRDGHVASSLFDVSELGLSKGLSSRGYLYTDKPTYRPGQKVSIRGIVRDVKEGSYLVSAGAAYKLSVLDSRGRLIRGEEVRLSDFGTFHSEMELDGNAPVGGYRITVQSSDDESKAYTGNFQVERFQLEKMGLTIDFPQRVYFRGEKVEATFTASYYYGSPVANHPIRYSLPSGQSHTEETDAEGKLKVVFDTVYSQPSTVLSFSGSIEGENVGVDSAVYLAHLGFSIKVKPSAEVALSGETFDVSIETIAADGKPVGKELALSVYKKTKQESHPILSRIPWLSNGRSGASAEVKVEEHNIATDVKTGEAVLQLDLEEGSAYVLRATGIDRFEQPVSGEGSVTISDDKDAVKLRLFAERAKLKVGSKEKVQIHSRIGVRRSHALVTLEGEGIIDYQILQLKENWNEVEFAVSHKHFPNFHMAVAVMEGQKLRMAGKEFTVERQLVVSMTLAKEAYLPGEDAEVEIRATDGLGTPVKAEFSLALVDEALFATYPDNLEPITDFFQKGTHRYAAMRTISSCTFRYQPATWQVVREVLEEADRLKTKAFMEHRHTSELDGLRKLAAASESLSFSRSSVRSRGGKADALRDEKGAEKQLGELQQSKAVDTVADIQLEEELVRESPGEHSIRKPRSAFEFFAGNRLERLGSLELNDQFYDRYGPDAATRGGRAAQIQIREEFAEAGYWLPAIVTDTDGRAIVKIPMPGKTTQWRLTARGCTVETLVGQAKGNTITRKDFFVDIKVPSIVTEGDKIRILARVHNLTDFTGDADCELTFAIDGRETVKSKKVNVRKNSSTETAFGEIEIPTGREVRVKVIAQAGEMTDGISRIIPIRPWGMEYADSKGGTSSGSETVFLQLPPGREYASRRMAISIGPSMSRLIFDLTVGKPRMRPAGLHRRIIPMPGDAASDLLAAAHALDYVKAVGGNPTDNRTLMEYARSLVSKIVVTQRESGGWSWCHLVNGGSTDVYVTARTVWALVEAKRSGVTVNPQTLEKGMERLKQAFNQAAQNDDEAKAVVLHALTRVGQADFAYANRLYRNRHQLSPASLAYTALIFANLNRNGIAGEILDVLEGLKKESRSGHANVCYWESQKAGIPSATPLMTSDIETTALVLLAMESVRPNSPLAKPAVDFLLSRRTYGGFSPYKAKGPIVAALAVYFKQTQFESSDYRLKISVNGKEIKSAAVESGQPTMLIDVPADNLADGGNRVEFALEGRGRYAYSATLSGFSPEITDPESWDRPFVRSRKYHHAPLEYRGRQISSSTTEITQLEDGARTYVSADVQEHASTRYLVIDEYLPAGMMLVDGSISGNHQYHEVGHSIITFYYPPNQRFRDYRYQLVSYAPGTYRSMPTVIRDAMRPDDMRILESEQGYDSLVVLAPGEKSTDEYEINDSELYGLGKAHFDDGKYAEAIDYLEKLHQRNEQYNEREVARMLLWMRAGEKYYDAKKMVQYFEILRERYPELYIPFDKILTVGRAYRDILEFERAHLVYKATIEASFVNDSNVSAVLQDGGQFLPSIDFQEALWQQYPDTPQINAAYFALSQALYSKADEAKALAKAERNVLEETGNDDTDKPQKRVTKLDILKETVIILSQFLTLYPEDALADDATFSMASVFLDLEDYPTAVGLCRSGINRYPESQYLSSFQYVEALGLFSQHKYDEAVKAAVTVADGKSKHRDLARYIIGQIYHAQGKPGVAIEWYGKVKDQYPDAQESITYFEEKRIFLDEVNIFRPKSDVEISLRYRNIKETELQVYRVDLMKLYLREKNLGSITRVQLAGIDPEISRNITLGGGKDYIDKAREVKLDIKDEGAYLIICRGDDLFTSGLALITPLEIEVQEEAVSGRVRVNVRDRTTGTFTEGVHVKVIGSANRQFKSGETDLRGIFIADAVRGRTTVITRDEQARYAFYRGKQWLGAPATGEVGEVVKEEKGKRQVLYRENIDIMNQAIQQRGLGEFDKMRRGQQKGVQVLEAQ